MAPCAFHPSLLVLVVSTSALKELICASCFSARLILFVKKSLSVTGPTYLFMTTSRPLTQQLSLPLTYGVQDGPVKISVTQTQTEEGLQEQEAVYSSRLWIWLEKFIQRGWSWKMCQVFSQQSEEPPLRQLSTRSKRMGIWGDGYRATLSMRAYPTTETEYSLSQVLDQSVPITSLLTAANCLGIIRRENRAKRKLDPIFVKAISETIRLWYNVAVASGTQWQKASAPRYVPKLEDIKEVIQTDRYSVARNLTWIEWERLMGFPPGWTVVEGDSLATPSSQPSVNGLENEL